MVKQEDENSNSSSDASSSSSFSSSSKPRNNNKQPAKHEPKPSSKNTNNSQQNKASTSSTDPSLIHLASNPSQQQHQQQLIYANPSNSLFNKINSFSGTTQFNPQQALQLQNLANMKSQIANQLAASVNSNGPSISASNNLSAQYDQAYFQHSSIGGNNDLYKLPVAGALHLLTSNNSKDINNNGSKNSVVNSEANSRERDRIALNSNCSNSSNSSNSSYNNGSNSHTGEIVVEETVRKREMRLLKNREAARECRRKKKEYIKCLENRVAVLESQNNTLIDELKSLKELYCQNGDPSH